MSNEARTKREKYDMNYGRTTEKDIVEPRANHEKLENEQIGNKEKISLKRRGSGEELSNEQLVARIRAGIDTADNMLQLWQQTERFIYKMAMKYQGYAELEDLKQEGYLGLCVAVQHYDADQGVSFITYAAFWIKQAMRRYVDNCSGVVRLPVHAREWIAKYKKMAREYRQYYGKEPTDRAMCYLLEVDEEKLHDIQKSMRMGQIQSLDVPLGEEDDFSLSDTVASDEDIEEAVIKRLDTAAMQRELWIEVDGLSPDQSEVIKKRYKDRMTRKETAESLGITPGAVQNLESKAMRLLRSPRRCKQCHVYYEQYISACSSHHVSVSAFERDWMSEVEWEVFGKI